MSAKGLFASHPRFYSPFQLTVISAGYPFSPIPAK